MKYIGQTGRTFKARFKEHIQDKRTNRHNSNYAQHILDTGHAYNTMDQTMKILHIEKKGHKLNTVERFEKYTLTNKALQLKERSVQFACGLKATEFSLVFTYQHLLSSLKIFPSHLLCRRS
jgi:hypothetical protein